MVFATLNVSLFRNLYFEVHMDSYILCLYYLKFLNYCILGIIFKSFSAKCPSYMSILCKESIFNHFSVYSHSLSRMFQFVLFMLNLLTFHKQNIVSLHYPPTLWSFLITNFLTFLNYHNFLWKLSKFSCENTVYSYSIFFDLKYVKTCTLL